MKKLFLIITLGITVLGCLTSCDVIVDTVAREPNEFSSNEDTDGTFVPKCIDCISIIPYSSVKDLADASDIVVHVKFLADLGVFNKIYGAHTFYEMQVVEVIKGNVSKGDVITVRIMGGLSKDDPFIINATDGLYKDVLYINNYSEPLAADYDYILFLESSGNDELPYGLTCIAQGYLPLKGGVLSLNTKIAGLSLFVNGLSAESIIGVIKGQQSSLEELARKKQEEEYQRAKHSIRWSVYNGITIYKDGYIGEFVKHSDSSRVSSFLFNLTVTGKLDGTPSDQIYHVGIFAPQGDPDVMRYPGYCDNLYLDSQGNVIYHTITLTDSALLYNGTWYAYDGDSGFNGKKLSDFYNEIRR